MDRTTIRPAAWQAFRRHVAWVWLVLAATVWLGCQPSKQPADSTPAGPAAAKSEASSEPASAVREPTPPAEPSASAGQTTPAEAGKQVTAHTVLEAMKAAYQKAARYADVGQIALQGQVGDQTIDVKWDYLVAVERPNKILLRSYQGILVSDGKRLSAYVTEVRNQVMQRPAPAALSFEALYADHLLASALTSAQVPTGAAVPAPLVLMLASDPLKTLLYRAEKTALLPSERLGDHLCYRVEVQRPDGAVVYWIDQTSHVLRRAEYPTEALKPMISSGPVDRLSLVAEFTAAQLDAPVDQKAFQFEIPPGTRVTDSFAPPDLELLGKPVPEFTFTDLDGKPITPKSLAGKIAVLDLWATWCGPCRMALPELQDVYRDFRGNDKIVFYAVSIDQPEVDNKRLQDVLAQWGVEIPVARDLNNGREALKVSGVPTTLAIGTDGTVQHFLTGALPGAAVELAFKLKRLLAGEDVARVSLQQYEQFKHQYEQTLRQWVANDVFVHSPLAEPQGPRAKVAPRTEPAALKMTRLWSCSQLKAPGNLLVVDRAGEPPRILVLDEGKAVAELASNGSLLATTPLKLPQAAAMASLRTGLDAAGRRLFAAFNAKWPQVYLLDEKLQPLLVFPKDDENPRMGIGDVQLCRPSPDGPPLMIVGYWGIAGVQGVGLDGARQWADKSLVEVSRVAVLAPDPQGRRGLLCTNIDRGTLVRFDWQGRRTEEIAVPNRTIVWIAAAPWQENEPTPLCALDLDKEGNVTAVGLTDEGKELWAYPLPPGMHETAVERIVAGQVVPGKAGNWILPAPDGTIHVLTADGKLLERFAYGARLDGLATAQLDGRPALLVATTQGVDAWQIEAPPTPAGRTGD